MFFQEMLTPKNGLSRYSKLPILKREMYDLDIVFVTIIFKFNMYA